MPFFDAKLMLGSGDEITGRLVVYRDNYGFSYNFNSNEGERHCHLRVGCAVDSIDAAIDDFEEMGGRLQKDFSDHPVIQMFNESIAKLKAR